MPDFMFISESRVSVFEGFCPLETEEPKGGKRLLTISCIMTEETRSISLRETVR